MFDPMLKKTILDLKSQILCWGLAIGTLLLFTVLMYPSISGVYDDILGELPEGIIAFWGIGEMGMDTMEGFLNVEFLSYAPIALAVFAILSGTATIVGEENEGTLDLLLAQPISRLKLIVVKLTGLTLAYGIIVGILLAVFWITVFFIDVELKAGRIIASFIMLWPFLTAIGFLSVLASLLLSNRLFAGTIMGMFLVASFVLESLSNLVSGLEAFLPIYATTYYQGSNALGGEISWFYTTTLMVVLLITFLCNIWLFMNRDIAVHKSINILPLTAIFKR